MIAVDTSVLIDLIGDDARADAAEAMPARCAAPRARSSLCDVVVGEVVRRASATAPRCSTRWRRSASATLPLECARRVRAGEMQRRYKERTRGGRPTAATPRVVPDFLIGAHALLQCSALITRDAGFFRDYFKGLKVIVPKAS